MKSQTARYGWGLLLVTIIAAVVRWTNIGANALWGDEALTPVIAGAPTWNLATSPLDPTGPFFYWLYKLLIPFSADPTTARLISFVCGVALVPVVYATGRQFLDRRGALFAAAVVAVAPLLVDFSQEARCYALLSLLLTGAVGLLLSASNDAVTSRRRWKLAGFAAVSIMALYTHLTAFFFVGALCIVLMEGADRTLSGLRKVEVYACWLAIVLASLPEVWRVYQYTTQANAFVWLSNFTVSGFAKLLADEFLPFVKGAQSALVYGVVALLFLALVVVAFRRFRKGAPVDRIATWALAVWLLQPALQWLLGYLLGPVLMTRTLNLVWPGFALTLGMMTMSFSPRMRTGVEGTLLAAYAVSLFLFGTVRQKEDWDGAANEIARAAPDLVIVCPTWKGAAFVSAARDETAPILALLRENLRKVNGAPARDVEAGYREAIWRFQHQQWLGEPTLSRAVSTVRRISLVQSECDQTLSDLLGRAGGGAVLKSRWVSPVGRSDANPALGQPTAIFIETYDLPQPATVQFLELRP